MFLNQKVFLVKLFTENFWILRFYYNIIDTIDWMYKSLPEHIFIRSFCHHHSKSKVQEQRNMIYYEQALAILA